MPSNVVSPIWVVFAHALSLSASVLDQEIISETESWVFSRSYFHVESQIVMLDCTAEDMSLSLIESFVTQCFASRASSE
jgi:hypothetical protein